MNAYSQIAAALVTSLQTLGTTYSGLVVEKRIFKPGAMPAFDRYMITVSPSNRCWTEARIAVPQIQYTFRFDVLLFVKAFHETDALWGETAPNLGLFQFVQDVKDLLRLAPLGGLIDKTYDEPGGAGTEGVSIEHWAAKGMDSGNHTFIHRALIPYVARVKPFVHPRN